MKLIPSEKIELKTDLSIQEVRDILSENIRPKKKVFLSFTREKETKRFEGTFENDEFKLQRIVVGKKSFAPQIIGKIQEDTEDTKLTMDMKLRLSTILFLIYALGFVSFALIMALIGVFNQDTNPILLIFPFIMLVFIIGLVQYSFSSEKEKSIRDMKEIFGSEILKRTKVK